MGSSYLSTLLTKIETKPLKPISRKTLAEQVVAILKRFILVEALQEGDRLPSERKLAVDLGVSYRVIREAVSRLAGEGIVGKQQGRGIFIRAFDRERLHGQNDGFPSFYSKTDICTLRCAIEMGAVCLAAEYATEEDLIKLQEIVEFKVPEAEPSMMGYDIRFHLALLRATHNEILQQLDYLLIEGIRLKVYDNPDRIVAIAPDQLTIAEHRAIVDALRKRDSLKAMVEMYDHMRSMRELARREEKLFGEHLPRGSTPFFIQTLNDEKG